MKPRQKAKLARLHRIVLESREEATKHQNLWNRTGDRMDLYRYKSARAVLKKAERKYYRYKDKVS